MRLSQAIHKGARFGGDGLANRGAAGQTERMAGEGRMKHYRINKLSAPDGAVIKKKDTLAANDREAVAQAVASGDCPVCDVLRDGRVVGEIR